MDPAVSQTHPVSPPFFDMTPPVAVYSEIERVTELVGKPPAMKIETQDYEVLEDYNGKYQFAPIEEAQVSRAMIKRRVSTQYKSRFHGCNLLI